ncbi:hypothetical protein CSPAE12_09233 [Colletotrichum incanum]|nr:hypothetical protein CSPAE12_09233 [Colletotrichum incanum]
MSTLIPQYAALSPALLNAVLALAAKFHDKEGSLAFFDKPADRYYDAAVESLKPAFNDSHLEAEEIEFAAAVLLRIYQVIGIELALGGKLFCFTATPCKHAPGQECVGFVIETDDFGKADDGWPNAIYFTGDIVYMDELAAMGQRSYIAAAIMNTGEAHAVRMFRDTKTDCIVPMNYNAWDHFTQHREGLAEVFESEGVLEKVKWLSLGKSVKILTANP